MLGLSWCSPCFWWTGWTAAIHRRRGGTPGDRALVLCYCYAAFLDIIEFQSSNKIIMPLI